MGALQKTITPIDGSLYVERPYNSADEIAAAAELVMGKREAIPVVIVRGYDMEKTEDGSAQELLRPHAEDLFR